jgi:large subunit ribosomal protein L28
MRAARDILRRHLARIGRGTVSWVATGLRLARNIGYRTMLAAWSLRVPAARLALHPVRRIFFDDWHGACLPEIHSDYFLWSDPVASVCDVCGKGPGFGNNVSHSHRRTPRRWNPNIQRVRAMVGKTPRRLNVCTSCIKAGKVSR